MIGPIRVRPAAAPGGRSRRTSGAPAGCGPRGSSSAARPASGWDTLRRRGRAVVELDAVAQRRSSPARRGRRRPRTRYSFSTPWTGGRCGWRVAVVGQQQQALGVGVEPADRRTPAGRSAPARRPSAPVGVLARRDDPGRLVEQVVDEPGRTPIGAPSTSIRSCSASTRRPSTATSPLTVTRPAAISSSQTRRLPHPVDASTFCRRSPWAARRCSAHCSQSGGSGVVGSVRRAGAVVAPPCRGRRDVDPGSPQPVLERSRRRRRRG